MITPIWLQAAGLVLWGITASQTMIGLLLACARLLVPASGFRMNLTHRDLIRAVDLTVVAIAIMVLGLFSAHGVSRGLQTATGWLPVALFPLLLISGLSENPIRLRHLALGMRNSTRPDADQVPSLDGPYLALTLLGTSVLAKESPWFFWALAGLIVAWLLVARSTHGDKRLAAFLLAAVVATGGAFAASIGLVRAHLALQEWVVDALSNTDSDPYQSQTRIGDLGRVKLSDRIVWRVDQAPPATVPLLLRSGVFTRFVSGNWLARRDSFLPLAAAPVAPLDGKPRRLTLYGESRAGSALLPLPVDAGKISGNVGTLQRNAYGVVRSSDAPPVLEFAVAAASPNVPDAQADTTAVTNGDEELALPKGFEQLLQRLPELAALSQHSERDRLAGVEAWFAANFKYTLFLGDAQSGGRDLERFLLTDRAGHCEYFATSTVLLLRALGMRARYVTGYSLQEYSSLEKAFLIRPRHAHAWAEVFVDGRWLEIDTTPSIWLTIEEDGASVFRPVSDFISFLGWRLTELRRALMAAKKPVGNWLAGVLLALFLTWLAFQGRKRMRQASGEKLAASAAQAEPRSAELRLFLAMEQELASLGLARRESETPRSWIARVYREGRTVLGEPRIDQASVLVEALYRSRYGSPTPR
jgi:transglutaminase-like putative cysteine protease